MNGFRAALRLAWRDALRTRVRSLLIVATIAFPVAVTTLVLLLRNGLRGMADSGDAAETAIGSAIHVLAIAFVVLETVLLAGPAFAVGMRRRRRLLALISASGGTPGQLRTVVLASGLVLGGLAGLAGTVCAFLLFWPFRWLLAERHGEEFLPFTDMILPWGWLIASVLTAVLSGLAAAYAPARQAARTDPAEVLSGRRSVPGPGGGLPLLGGLLIVAGLVFVPLSLNTMREIGPALGAALLIVGGVLVVPSLVALTGRYADRLPLPARLAVRDSARNRVRTAPAVAAVMAATAALTALAIGGSSDLAQERLEYRPHMEPGQAMVSSSLTEEQAQRAVAAIQRVLPDRPVARIDRVDFAGEREIGLECEGEVCSLFPFDAPYFDGFVFGEPESVPLLLGRDDPAVGTALADGKAAVFVKNAVVGGEVAIVVREFVDGESVSRTVRLPAVQAERSPRSPYALLPPALAAPLGVTLQPAALMVDGPVDRAQDERLDAELRKIGTHLDARVERGFEETFTTPALIMGVAAAVLVLGAALLVTALAAVDSRPDLATLTAVGARPGTRRLLLMAQAGYVALLGCGLGIALGAVPGVAVAVPLTNRFDDLSPPHGTILDVPWLFLLFVLVALPLVTAAVAGLFTRGGQVLPERAAT